MLYPLSPLYAICINCSCSVLCIVHSNKECFKPSGVWSIATIEVALRLVHRPIIVDDSYSSHDKEKEKIVLYLTMV